MRINSSHIKNLQTLTAALTKDKNSDGIQIKDKLDISNTAKAFQKLDDFMNLGKGNRFDMSGLNETEKEEFLKMLATLIQHGIIGYEEYEIDGKREKHYIVNTIGDTRLYGAKTKYVRD